MPVFFAAASTQAGSASAERAGPAGAEAAVTGAAVANRFSGVDGPAASGSPNSPPPPGSANTAMTPITATVTIRPAEEIRITRRIDINSHLRLTRPLNCWHG